MLAAVQRSQSKTSSTGLTKLLAELLELMNWEYPFPPQGPGWRAMFC
jgi:hypothetical protein